MGFRGKQHTRECFATWTELCSQRQPGAYNKQGFRNSGKVRGPAVFQLLRLWACSRAREHLGEGPIPYITITIYKSYRAKRHRYRKNLDPSIGFALGNYIRGGRLRYWTKDDLRFHLASLNKKTTVLLYPGSVPVVFNGNLAHEVEDYEGEERFSVILFTHGKYELASAETRSVLQEAGCSWPTLASLQILSKWDHSGSPIEKPRSGTVSYTHLTLPTKRIV